MSKDTAMFNNVIYKAWVYVQLMFQLKQQYRLWNKTICNYKQIVSLNLETVI